MVVSRSNASQPSTLVRIRRDSREILERISTARRMQYVDVIALALCALDRLTSTQVDALIRATNKPR